jgi:hypothetical protein
MIVSATFHDHSSFQCFGEVMMIRGNNEDDDDDERRGEEMKRTKTVTKIMKGKDDEMIK